MVCCRCKRAIVDTEAAIYSSYRKVNYCPQADWPDCDRIYAERMKEMRAEDAA
jgi:roadblock/LC7 domain-containing protein